MNATWAVLFGGLTAAITWGFADYLAAHASKRHGPILAAAVDNMLGAVVFTAIYLAFLSDVAHPHVAGSELAYALGAGVFLALAMAAFFRGLEIGPVSIVSPLGSLYPLITTLVAVVVFGGSLSVLQGLGIVMIVLGVLAGSGLLTLKKSERKLQTGPRFALAAALFWGISFSLQAQAVQGLGWQLATIVSYIALTVTYLVITPFIKGNEVFNRETLVAALKSKYIIGATLLGMTGFLTFNYGVSQDESSGALVAALSATYPIITVFLALHHMKESVKFVSLAGALVGVAGVIVLSVG